MDACPHWGEPGGGDRERFLRVARCDGCCGIAAMALGAGLSPGASRRAVVAGMLGGAVVDADKPLEHFFGWNPFPGPVQRFHVWIQREAPHRLAQEVAMSALLAVAVVATRGVESRRKPSA